MTGPAPGFASHPNGVRATWEDTETAILDVRTFALLAKTMAPSQFRAFVFLSILDIDTRLVEIASRRVENDFSGVARVACHVAILAGNLGAARSMCIALELERKCRNEEPASTYHLISELAAALDMARDDMRRRLADDSEADVIEAE